MNVLKKIWHWAGKKLIVLIVANGIAALKAAHPEWPIPNEDFIKDLTLAFLGAHTLTDVAALLKTAGKEIVAGKAAPDAGS